MKKHPEIKSRPLRFIVATVLLAALVFIIIWLSSHHALLWEWIVTSIGICYLLWDIINLYFQSFGYDPLGQITNFTPFQKAKPIYYIYNNNGKAAGKEDMIYVPKAEGEARRESIVLLHGMDYYIDGIGRVILTQKTFNKYYINFWDKVEVLR